MTDDGLIARRRRSLGPAYRLFYRHPVELVRGAGCRVWDADGREYLDAYNNVPSVGHAHPRVVAAVHEQMQRLVTNTRYVAEAPVAYAERLLATMPAELGHVMYACSGSEANDLALRVARFVTGHDGVVVTANAYHGLTAAVAAISPSLGAGSPLGPHVRTVELPDPKLPVVAAGRQFVARVEAAVADLERHGHGLAALVADGLFASDGVHPDPAGFLAPAVARARAAGGLYVGDEVQCGFGRTGEQWWGFARHAVVPDVVTLGKPMGNGLPIAAAVFRPDLLAEFGARVRYFNTGGGNSACIAAAGAVLDVIVEEDLIGNASRTGAALRRGLEQLAATHGGLGAVRGAGLFFGVDVVDPGTGAASPRRAADVVEGLRERGVLVSTAGARGDVLKIRPPLCFADPDLDLLLDRLAATLSDLTQRGA